MEIAGNSYSILNIGDKYFGVEIFGVREIIQLPKFTKVPNTHKSIIGVFNLRGEIYSIIDLRVLIEMPANPVNNKNLVVLLRYESLNFGVIVDKVVDIVDIDPADLQQPDRDIPVSYKKFVSKYYKHDKLGNIYILNIAALSSAEEIAGYRYR
ncbi:MAG: chemotaxis protein CheW [Calditrichaceae bacterium]|nr:chemotaxis protein CheW [Calditrichaceae bacterium]MBN2709069.1 chemotaxis protein CheW [Calditrichaceae bacterium]RQV97027.1 MAG: hypothetical protein EH224_02715 [Calditrichota bacterium]